MGSRTILAAVLTAVATGLVLLQALQWGRSARFDPTVTTDSRCALRIVATDPADSSSGLREGDLLRLPDMTSTARGDIVYHFGRMHPAPLGSVVSLAVVRDGRTRLIPYHFVRHDGPLAFATQLAFKLVILAIGVFVLWRGRGRAAVWLGAWCAGVAVALPDAWWGGLPEIVRWAGSALNSAIWTVLPFGLYMVVESIVTGVRKPLVWIARSAMAISVAPAFVVDVFDTNAQLRSGCAITGLDPTFINAMYLGSQLIVLAYFVVGYAETHGLERLRLRWVFWAFVLSRFGVLLNLMNRLFVHPLQLTGIEWLGIVVFPLGCAYAILRHRLIDVNFVLNRTLIYTILTTIIVGVFVMLEHVLEAVTVSRGVGFVMEAAVALAIGLSFNALHKRVEGMLDRTVFRAKYEALSHLQRIAEEAAYMESPDALLARATKEIPDAIGASGSAVYERRDGAYLLVGNSGLPGLPDRIDPDDPAFVRLRKRLSQVDLADVDSAMGNDAIAFAFAIRGQLTGAFLCGRRKNGETYAPDEISAVQSVAHEVGAELSAIRGRERAELLSGLISGRIDLATAREAPDTT
jgi:hypothetical protein